MKELTAENLRPYVEFLMKSKDSFVTVGAVIKGGKLKGCDTYGDHTISGGESKDGAITEERLETARASALNDLKIKLQKIRDFLSEFDAAK